MKERQDIERKLNQHQQLEYSFYRHLSCYLQAFRMLDQHLGLCIARMVSKQKPSLAYPLLKKMNLFEKVDALKSIILEKHRGKRGEMVDEYTAWSQSVVKLKAARDRYLNGYWEIHPDNEHTPVVFNPLHWEISTTAEGVAEHQEKKELSLNEFIEITDEMRDVFYAFMDFRGKWLES